MDNTYELFCESAYDPGRSKEYAYNETEKIPKEKGTYRFLSGDSAKTILYIGIASNLNKRVATHKSEGKKLKPGEKVAIKVALPNANWGEIRKHEKQKVEQHNPERNERGGGGGRTPILDED